MNDEDRQRLAEVKAHGVGWATEHDLAWLIERVEEMQQVLDRTADIADDYRERAERAEGFLRMLIGDLNEMSEIARLERERAEAAEEREKALRAVASSVLYHDERGQGVGYAESMKAMQSLLTED